MAGPITDQMDLNLALNHKRPGDTAKVEYYRRRAEDGSQVLSATRVMKGPALHEPKAYIIAGSQCAGKKTSFAREFLPHMHIAKNFINADLFAQGVHLFSPGSSHSEPGKTYAIEIDRYGKRRY